MLVVELLNFTIFIGPILISVYVRELALVWTLKLYHVAVLAFVFSYMSRCVPLANQDSNGTDLSFGPMNSKF